MKEVKVRFKHTFWTTDWVDNKSVRTVWEKDTEVIMTYEWSNYSREFHHCLTYEHGKLEISPEDFRVYLEVIE